MIILSGEDVDSVLVDGLSDFALATYQNETEPARIIRGQDEGI